MSNLLMNNFQLPEDNWYQISSLGEFKHNPTGLLQIIDADSCRAMVDKFDADSAQPNFPGILIDFDHFSLDTDKPSEAAGWIVELQQRPAGLWAKIRWSDKGEEAVRGGRYRFISPVFRQDECLSLGDNRIKPQHLVNAAVTNDPNISGMVPLSNKRADEPASQPHRKEEPLCIVTPLCEPPIVNRMPPSEMSDEQRKAVFAHMGGGGGGGGGGGSGGSGGGGGGSGGGMGRSKYDYSSSRNSDARINAMTDQRNRMESQAPRPPELKTFDLMDTRQLRDDLIQEGVPFDQVYKQVAAAEERNRQTKKELWDIKKQIHQKYKDPARQKAAMQTFFDKVDVANQKLVAEYDHAMSEHRSQRDELDRAIEEERIRAGEAGASATRKEYNDEVKAQIERDKAALRAAKQTSDEAEKYQRQLAREDAAEKRAQEKAAKENDPVRLNDRAKKTNRAYWESLSRGDITMADKIAPGADHKQNADDLAKMLPGGKRSPRNEKTYQSVVKMLESESPQ